jgi:PAS domain-containing protein
MERVHRNPNQWLATASAKVRYGVSIAFEELSSCFQWMQTKLDEVTCRAKKEHEKLQDALRYRENLLAKLLDDSSEAIVVTDDTHRLLAANLPALDLFGISKTNLKRFTIDAFLPYSSISSFERHGLPFIRGMERHGECMIRRLNGDVRLVEFSFQANFVPGRHLSKFHDVTLPKKPKIESRAPSG